MSVRLSQSETDPGLVRSEEKAEGGERDHALAVIKSINSITIPIDVLSIPWELHFLVKKKEKE